MNMHSEPVTPAMPEMPEKGELVFGLVGLMGVDLSSVCQALNATSERGVVMEMKNGRPAFLSVIEQVREEVERWPAWMKYATSVVDYAMPEMAVRGGGPAPRDARPSEQPTVARLSASG